MEISSSSIYTFYTSRIFGLAPYLIVRNESGRIVNYKFSRLICLFSLTLICCISAFTIRGIMMDAKAKKPIRMKGKTSRFVTALDVAVVVVSCCMGCLCGIFGINRCRKINHLLHEINNMLPSIADTIRDKRKNITLVIGTMFIITTVTVLDWSAWFRIAGEAPRNQTNEVVEEELNVTGYIPFYILYYILAALQAQLANTVLGVGRRLQRLNKALKYQTLHYIHKEHKMESVNLIRIPSIKNVNQTVDILASQKHHTSSIFQGNNGKGQTVPAKDMRFIEKMAFVHSALIQIVNELSSGYGLAFIAILTSCLLHLVATSYFFFVEILGGKRDPIFSLLQLLWLGVHIVRLFLVVEPCHITSLQANKTLNIISELQRNTLDPMEIEHLAKFWRQLMADKMYISACGLCKIDRELFTAFSGAIATYLIILIQFQKTDG